MNSDDVRELDATASTETDVTDGFEVLDPEPTDDRFDVTLPVTRADFADFLGKVIGGKDKLEYSFRGYIHVSSALISGIESALVERVETQNGGRLVSSRYDVRFSNGRGFKTSNIESLLGLSPRGNASTEFLGVELIFLINFPGSNTPVREKISLAFAASYGAADDESILRKRGVIDRARCEIEYYNRVFAEDCLSTITSIVEGQSFVPPNVSYAKRVGSLLGSSLPITTFCVAGLVYSLAVYQIGTHFTDWIPTAAEKAALTLEEKVDGLIERTAPFMVALYTSVLILIGLLCSLVPAVLVSMYIPESNVGRVSFGLYANDLALMDGLARKKTRRTIRALLGILLSVVLSIVGAYIYDRAMGRI